MIFAFYDTDVTNLFFRFYKGKNKDTKSNFFKNLIFDC